MSPVDNLLVERAAPLTERRDELVEGRPFLRANHVILN